MDRNYTIKINGKEIFLDDIVQALDLVEVTYETCKVVFCDNLNKWETGRVINDIIDFTELCEMYD